MISHRVTSLISSATIVLIDGTGTGKSHLAVRIARSCIRPGKRGRFFNVFDLVNKLDDEARDDRQARTAGLLCCLDFLILDDWAICRSRKLADSSCSISTAISTNGLRSSLQPTSTLVSDPPSSVMPR